MNTRMLFVGPAAMIVLLGCSNARVEPVQAVAPVLMTRPVHDYQYPPTDVERMARQFEELAQPAAPTPSQREGFIGRFCRVGGSSCMELDDRPFETCLLSSQDCGKKVEESLRRGENIGPPRSAPMR